MSPNHEYNQKCGNILSCDIICALTDVWYILSLCIFKCIYVEKLMSAAEIFSPTHCEGCQITNVAMWFIMRFANVNYGIHNQHFIRYIYIYIYYAHVCTFYVYMCVIATTDIHTCSLVLIPSAGVSRPAAGTPTGQ